MKHEQSLHFSLISPSSISMISTAFRHKYDNKTSTQHFLVIHSHVKIYYHKPCIVIQGVTITMQMQYNSLYLEKPMLERKLNKYNISVARQHHDLFVNRSYICISLLCKQSTVNYVQRNQQVFYICFIQYELVACCANLIACKLYRFCMFCKCYVCSCYTYCIEQ